ncbi:MAG: hypothetical protein H7Z13_02390 [Ferruginibacter sp.]|nr:hypothetical protein [Ferruginibacter sp.]
MIKPEVNQLGIEAATGSHSLVIFDIFGTLVTRLVCSPKSVFYFVARSAIGENLISCSPDTYIQLRQEAAWLSKTGKPDTQMDGSAILQFLTRLLGVSREVGKRLMELETAWELRLSVIVPGAVELLMEHRNKGNRIAFVSNMYWTKELLVDLLRMHNLWSGDDQLWILPGHDASATGTRLYQEVLNYKQINKVSAIHHFGNNKIAGNDRLSIPGFKSTELPKANPNRYENLLETFSESSGGLSSLLSGAGRLVRMNYADAPSKNAAIAGIVGNVVGPSFTLYVLWLLRTAKAEGVNRLYFVSRDGYIPYKIAGKIIGQVAPEIKISYLYGSRQAWHIAGLHEFDPISLSWIFQSSDGATAASIINRTGIEWEEFTSIVPGIGIKIKNPFSKILPDDFNALKSIILSNKQLQERILEEAKIRRALLLEYLDQEGFNTTEKIGMVELGWVGRTRNSIEKVIGTENAGQLHWFYLGLLPFAQAQDLGRVHAFLYGPVMKFPAIEALPLLAESFSFAPHGSVRGFIRKNGKVIPCFKEGIERQLDEWGRLFYLSVVDEFCDHLPVTMIENGCGFDLRSPAYYLLKEFSENPGRDDALIWGTVPYEHDQSGSAAQVLSPQLKLNYPSIKEAFMFGSLAKATRSGQVAGWGAGAWVARSNTVFPLYIFAFIGYLKVKVFGVLKRIAAKAK